MDAAIKNMFLADSSRGASYSNPISVDEFLEVESEVETEGANPISVDEFLGVESEVETEDVPDKEKLSPESLETGSVETRTVATDILSVEAQEEPAPIEHPATDFVEEESCEVSFDRYDQDSSINGTTNVDPNDCNSNQDHAKTSIEEENLAPEAVDDSKSEKICAYENREDDFENTAIADTKNDYEYAVALQANDGSSHRGHRSTAVQGRYTEPQLEAQEWTHEDHCASEDHKRHLSREQQRMERYERAERRRIAKLMWFGVFLLLLEVAGAIIAVINHQELIECCGRSIFSENESVGERWNKAFYLIGILYIPVILLIEIPTLVIAQETVFLFNPMVGFLLTMQMIYVTDLKNAYIIFGLEALAMLGQSMILMQMPRSFESCIHSVVNYTLMGMTLYMIILLTRQGGFCIVNDRIQSVFSESTCNIGCIDEESCFRCAGGDDEVSFTQCFIRFQEI